MRAFTFGRPDGPGFSCYKGRPMSSFRVFLQETLAALESRGLLRSRSSGARLEGLLNVSSNDYLGYAAERVSRETLTSLGAGASRLIHGTRPEHERLEKELAGWVGAQDALVFTSGYAANVGTLSALCGPGDLIVSDALNHASLIDGCKLSRARIVVVPHRDLHATEQALASPAARKWVVSESYFSMDGTSPDLPALRALCDRTGAALILDEAHALGVFGPAGSGLAAAAGVIPDVLVGTLGKAVGVQGAFVAGCSELTQVLWNRARSFVFSTGISPLLAWWAHASVIRAREDDAGRARLREACLSFERQLVELGVPLDPLRHGPIFPVLLESPDRALRGAALLRSRGFLVQAIRPPTVPEGTSRLRITMSSTLAPDDVRRLAAAVRDACSV